MSTTVSKTEYWRLKSDGFVSIKEEFPGVPSDWTPSAEDANASTLCNSNGVFLSEIDPVAWILSAGDPLISLDAKALDQYVQRLLDESYAGAGEPNETLKRLRKKLNKKKRTVVGESSSKKSKKIKID